MRRGPTLLANRRRRSFALGAGAATLAVATAVSAAGLSWSDPAADGDGAASNAPAGHFETITLVTGDQVVIRDDGKTRHAPQVIPAQGRESVGFSVYEHDGHVTVLPSDAKPLTTAGVVDPRLFEVTGLLAEGHGDADGDSLPLLVDDEPTLQSKEDAGDVWETVVSGSSDAADSSPALWLDDSDMPAVASGDAEGDHEVAVSVVDRDGEPADFASVSLFELSDDAPPEQVVVEDGEGSAVVPAGEYAVQVDVDDDVDGDATQRSLLTEPLVSVDADTALDYDARDAEEVSVSLDVPDTQVRNATVGIERTGDVSGIGFLIMEQDFEGIHIGHVGEPTSDDELETRVMGSWEGAADDATAPAYHAAWAEFGEVPAGFDAELAESDMAEVESSYRADVVEGTSGEKSWTAFSDSGWGMGPIFDVELPGSRVDFHNVDESISWEPSLEQYDEDHYSTAMTATAADREPGETYSEVWNSAVFGPGLPSGADWTWAERDGDAMDIVVPMHSDGDPRRYGHTDNDSARTALYADDELLEETENAGDVIADVPAGSADYRLEVDVTGGDAAEFSTEVSAAWTFASESGDDAEALPISALRFAPDELDDHNRAEAGGSVDVPITVQSQDRDVDVETLDVSASFDAGDTWEELDVVDDDGTFSVQIDHPDDAEHTSLQATMVDSDGNTAELTVIHAYGLH